MRGVGDVGRAGGVLLHKRKESREGRERREGGGRSEDMKSRL